MYNHKILKQKTLWQKSLFKFDEVDLEIDTFAGKQEQITRYELKAPEVVAAVVYLEDTKKIILVEQFRYSATSKSNGWTLEIVAGLKEKHEDIETALKREVLEETGYQAKSWQKIYGYFPNIGFTNQFLHLYLVKSSTKNKIAKGGGVLEEKEDIKVHELSINNITEKLHQGFFIDSKTIIGLQWFLLQQKNNFT